MNLGLKLVGKLWTTLLSDKAYDTDGPLWKMFVDIAASNVFQVSYHTDQKFYLNVAISETF